MKKIFFTAIGLIAFSGVSMANSSKKLENNNVITIKTIFYKDCNSWAMNFCTEMNGWNDTDSVSAYKAYRQVVEFCETASEIKYLERYEDFTGVDFTGVEIIEP